MNLTPGPALILERKQIWLALVLLTMVSIVVSVGLCLVALALTTTGHPDATLTEREVRLNVIVFSAVIPGIICPLVVYNLLNTMRELNIARAELDKISKRDPLTGLLNRRGLEASAERLLVHARASRQNVAVLMCDIDFFKKTNDKYGHDGGDFVIQHVAGLLTQVMASATGAAIGRHGGEEFAVVMTGQTVRTLAQFAETIRRAIETSTIKWDDKSFSITISLGCSIATHDQADFRELMTRADQALYDAKRRGRNRAEVAALAQVA